MENAIEKKSFWQRPESITTVLSFLVIGAFGFKFLDSILPVVNRVLDFALESMVKGVLVLGLASLITFLAVNRDWHKVVWLAYQMFMRKLTEIFVTLDPIAVMKEYLMTLHKNLAKLAKGLGELRGQARELENQLRINADRLKQSQDLADQAAKQAIKGNSSMKTEFLFQRRKAGRLEKSSVTYQGLLARIKAHIALMEKVQESAKFMTADIEDTIEEETRKRRLIRASYKVMLSAKGILASNEQRELYDMALEANTQDYFTKLGEIEQFMEDSQSFINSVDLQNGVFEEEALAKLQSWEQRSVALLEGGTGKTKYRIEPAATHDFAEIDRDVQSKIAKGEFDDLFSKM